MTDAPEECGEQDFVELVSVSTLFEAQMKIAVLKDAGIAAIVRECSGDFGATPNQATDRGIVVLVQHCELVVAREQLASVTQAAHRVDWDAVEMEYDGPDPAPLPRHSLGRLVFVAITAVIAAIALILSTLFR